MYRELAACADRSHDTNETVLHREATGPVWLKDDAVAEIVSEALRFRGGERFSIGQRRKLAASLHGSGTQPAPELPVRALGDDCCLVAGADVEVVHGPTRG